MSKVDKTRRTFLIATGSILVVTGIVVAGLYSCAQQDDDKALTKTLPPDSGIVDVKADYGAKGDGTTDDTEAIQEAVEEGVGEGKIVYLPEGTYLVSDRLEGKDSTGEWQGQMKLWGQNRGRTAIKLRDNASGYTDSANPKALLYTASSLTTGSASAGNKDYDNLGEGNEAFGNYVENLTVDTGNNLGAIGIDYLANNHGAVREVTVRGKGKVGLSMTRKWPGPCLIQNVKIEGFDYGIYAEHREYGITFENISLFGQKVAGIRNEQNVLSIQKLTSTNSVPAIKNAHDNGLVTLIDGDLSGGSSALSAIDNRGGLFARNVKTAGYASAIENEGAVVPGTTVDEWVSSEAYRLSPTVPQKSLDLPVREAPTFHENDLAEWANVESYDAKGDDWDDDTDAIQAALDSGKSTVYFPEGRYFVRDTLRIRGNVRKVAGMGSILAPTWDTFDDANDPKPLLKVETGDHDATIVERLNMAKLHQSSPTPGLIGIEQESYKALVLRDMVCCGGSEYKHSYRSAAGAGPLFLENVVGNRLQFGYPQSVWARQFNSEDNNLRVTNSGADLWILGIKTEGTNTVVSTSNGGRTELLGGLLYPVAIVPAKDVAFVDDDSEVSLTYATSAHAADNDYQIHVEETQGGETRTLTRGQVASRGEGTMVPLYRAAKE